MGQDDLNTRLTVSEKRLSANDQRYLELETADNIMERLIKWAKRIAFVVGIPFVVGGLFVGKQIKDLHDFATAAKDTVASEVEKARTTVETAKRIATEARTTSDATMKAVNTAKDSVAAVQKQAQAGQVEVSRLRDVTARADSEVLALQAQVGDNKKQITVLASRLDDISVENTSAALGHLYPGAYGQRRISTPKDGSIAYSGPCRSAFRGDGDQCSKVMPIAIPG